MSTHAPTIDLGYPTPAHGRIPSFKSVEEEAEFWDPHDADEFRQVEVTLGGELAERLTAPLTRSRQSAHADSQ